MDCRQEIIFDSSLRMAIITEIFVLLGWPEKTYTGIRSQENKLKRINVAYPAKSKQEVIFIICTTIIAVYLVNLKYKTQTEPIIAGITRLINHMVNDAQSMPMCSPE